MQQNKHLRGQVYGSRGNVTFIALNGTRSLVETLKSNLAILATPRNLFTLSNYRGGT